MCDWKKCRIKDIAEVVGGGTPSTNNKGYWNGNISWLTPKDLTGYNSMYISKGERSITEQGLKNSSAKELPAGTVLFTSRAPIGYVAIAKNPLATNQGFKSLIVDHEKVNNVFLYYWLKDNVEYLNSLGSGTTFAEISGSVLKETELLLPPLHEQRAIAEILSSLDDKIDLLHRNSRTLEALVELIYHKTFLVDGDETVRLGSVLKTTSGGTPSRTNNKFYNGQIPWIKSKELPNGFVLTTEERITSDAIKNSSAKLLPAFSVLIAMYGATVGELGISTTESTCNQAIAAVPQTPTYPYTFLYSFFNSIKNDLINLAVGAAQQNISQVLIQELQIPKPSDKIEAFDRDTRPLYEKILNNAKQNNQLKSLRDILLSKLMNGSVKVNELVEA